MDLIEFRTVVRDHIIDGINWGLHDVRQYRQRVVFAPSKDAEIYGNSPNAMIITEEWTDWKDMQ